MQLNRDFLVTGSWNIQEELRRVRSRATEEMLRTRSTSKMDWSALASGYKGCPSVSGDGEFGGARNKLSNFTQLIDVPLKWGSAATTSGFTGVFFTCLREIVLVVDLVTSATTCGLIMK